MYGLSRGPAGAAMRKILICGSRHWTNRDAIHRELESLRGQQVTVIEGGCRGADRLAAVTAPTFGFAVEEYQAAWRIHGHAAGPIRNTKMLVEGKPDEVWAFHEDLRRSKGTADMVRQAQRAGIPVKVFIQ